MSEIKPCVNTECPLNKKIYPGHCELPGWRQFEGCPKYRSEPKPEPWKPLNPDEYEPGCTNEGCVFFNSLHNCNCSKIQVDSAIYRTKHQVMCECVNCYRPKKKPETVRKLYIEFVVDSSNSLTDDEVLIHARNHLRALYGNIKRCEIIEEETK